MSDDEYDDELPSITVNTSTNEDVQFTMPSADVLASQRAREEECELELRQLRSQYENLPVSKISPHDSSGSEGEAALAAAVDAMRVQPLALALQPEAAALLHKLISNLATYDTTFLKDYLEVLQTEDVTTITSATDSVMENIEEFLKHMEAEGKSFSGEELVVLGAWLSAAAVWARPRVPGARRALHVVLAHYTDDQTRAVCAAWAASAPAATLLCLSDAARAPHRRRSLAAPLLRAALAQLLPPQPAVAQDACAPLSCAELAGALAPAWRALPAAARYTAAQLAGRVLADTPADILADTPADTLADTYARDGAARLLALLATAAPAGRQQPDHLKVMVAVSKLQVLFREKT